jgi:hypothetical protein
MKTQQRYTAADILLEMQLSSAANEEGTIQAGDMLQFTAKPELHTTMTIARAFNELTGKPYDFDFFCP